MCFFIALFLLLITLYDQNDFSILVTENIAECSMMPRVQFSCTLLALHM